MPIGACWKRHVAIALLLAASLAASRAWAGGVVDDVRLGDGPSEQSHRLNGDHSEVIKGGLDEAARQLLPLKPESFDGGSMTFTMKVDPKEQNYVTVKLWGSDKGEASGRLILYANGLQVGYRHEGDYDVLNQTDEEGLAPGRFVYQTVPLPLALTQGQNSITLKIAALGPMWPYGQTFEQYQKKLTVPSRGIYRVYMHTDARFVPDASEKQGNMPAATVRQDIGEEVIAETKKTVIDRLNRMLKTPVSAERATDRKARENRLFLLAEAYNTPWTPAYHDPRVIEQILQDGDATAQAFTQKDTLAADNYASSSWLGAGPLGLAIMQTHDGLAKRLDETITINGKPVARRDAWADAMHQSVNYWRTHRRSYTNQSMIVDWNIYTANRGLQIIAPKLALPESQAMAYVYQAVGLEPWLGSDPRVDKAPVPDSPDQGMVNPHGLHHYLITRKGLSRELGWVGSYGETILHFMVDMVKFTGDEKLRQHLAKLQRARMYFRYPALDADGYRCMKLASEVDNRTAHYPLKGSAYNAPNIREEWWMDVPAVLHDDPVAVGAAQQSIEEGQYFVYIKGRAKDPDTLGMMRNVDEYTKVKSLPASGYRLPMTKGQPDFAFADEEDAIIAVKDGETQLFVNLYYRAERAVNYVARIYEVTPTLSRLVTARTYAEAVPSGQTYTRRDWIDWGRGVGHVPPGQEIHQAWAGEVLPISARPADVRLPAYGDWGPYLGRAAYYQVQYGPYLIMMNCSDSKEHAITVPPEFAGGRDLISGKPASEMAGALKPLTTVVLRAAVK